MSNKHFLIAGAGIGGLSAALFLSRIGVRVGILEYAEQASESGAGIQLSPNAMRQLAALGLRDAVLRHASQPQSIAVRDVASGRTLSRMLLGAGVQKRYGETYCTLRRADLQAVLLQAVQERPLISLQWGCAVQSYVQQEQGVAVVTRQGQHLLADGLIGADGLWGRVRTQLLGDVPPRMTGHAAFRTMLSAAQVPDDLRHNEIAVWWGHRVHVVSYPVDSGQFWNVVVLAQTPDVTASTQDSAMHQGWSLDARTQDVRRALGHTCEPLCSLIEIPTAWKRWNLFDRPAVTCWGEGATSLLGDAAHPMLPYLAQGAAMALEDAAVLARCVQATSGTAQALRQYEALRTPRTERVVRHARRNGQIFHMRGPLALARNAVLALRGTQVVGLPWLYGYAG